VKFTISIPRESCTNAKAKYSSSVVPPDPSVHFYHCSGNDLLKNTSADKLACCAVLQCGFFKRHKPGDDSGLYKAKMEKQKDFSDFD